MHVFVTKNPEWSSIREQVKSTALYTQNGFRNWMHTPRNTEPPYIIVSTEERLDGQNSFSNHPQSAHNLAKTILILRIGEEK